MLAGLGERRRELAILRSVGAGPRVVFMLLAIEGLTIVVAGSLLGLLSLIALSYFAAPYLEAHLGISLPAGLISAEALELLCLSWQPVFWSASFPAIAPIGYPSLMG